MQGHVLMHQPVSESSNSPHTIMVPTSSGHVLAVLSTDDSQQESQLAAETNEPEMTTSQPHTPQVEGQTISVS